jgi:hypothetical protein
MQGEHQANVTGGIATVFVQTVQGNYEGYTKKEVLMAKEEVH